MGVVDFIGTVSSNMSGRRRRRRRQWRWRVASSGGSHMHTDTSSVTRVLRLLRPVGAVQLVWEGSTTVVYTVVWRNSVVL